MAKFELFADKLLTIEGGYVDHPNDKGGPTKYGVILSTWRQYGHDKDGDGDIDKEDIKRLEKSDAYFIAKTVFWDSFKADQIMNQTVADFIVDWGYNSGTKTAAKQVQRVLKVVVDGAFGPKTVEAINSANPRELLEKLKEARRIFIDGIVASKPDQKVFYKGWMNRINAFKIA
jgi:lysozyme family protein